VYYRFRPAAMTAATLQVYSGQRLVREIEDRGRGKVSAFRIEGTERCAKIGVFPTRIAAMRAVIAAASREQGRASRRSAGGLSDRKQHYLFRHRRVGDQ
jgi:hypothetical protein